jgi:hypothetical protein
VTPRSVAGAAFVFFFAGSRQQLDRGDDSVVQRMAESVQT